MCAALLVAACAAADEPPEGWTAGKHRWGFVGKGRTEYILLQTCGVISRGDLESFAELMHLTEPQANALDDLYDDYIAADWAYRSGHLQPLYDATTEISARGDISSNLFTAEEFVALMKRRNVVDRKLVSIEDQLFSGLQPFLTESQLIGLEHARMRRSRTRAMTCLAGTTYPGVQVDIVSRLEGVATTPEMRETVLEYERELTFLFGVLLRTTLRVQMTDTLANAERGELVEAVRGGDPGAIQRYDEIKRSRYGANRRVAAVQRRIHDLHFRYLDLFAAEYAVGAHVESWLRDRIYKLVLPDRADVTDTLSDALESPTLAPELVEAIDAIKDGYHATADRLNDRMITTYLDWKTETVARAGYTHEGYAEYQNDMKSLQRQRIANARNAIEMLQSIAGEEIPEELAAACSEDLTRLETIEVIPESWPGPYD